ncbi:MAG: hypothetical protein ACJ735_08105 [Actinomycetes bacterium]
MLKADLKVCASRPNYKNVINPLARRTAMTPNPQHPLTAWRCLTAGVPLALLLDLAAGPALDSAAILHDEEVARMAGSAWALAHDTAPAAWAELRGA